MTEQAMMQGLAHGNQQAIRWFYIQFRPRILAVARRVVRDEFEAEDVFQDVAFTVVRKADSFRGDAQFSSWLYRVTQNCAKMLLRRKRRVPSLMTDDVLERTLGDAGTPRLDDALAQREVALRVADEVDRLDPVNRKLFLAAAEGDSTEQLSELTGLSPLAVKARLHRTRERLREHSGWSVAA